MPKTITSKQLEEMLLGMRGAVKMAVYTETPVRMLLTNNPFRGAKKRRRLSVLTSFKYAEGVERRRTAEGKDPQGWNRGESWSRPVTAPDGALTPLACHKDRTDEMYLRCQVMKRYEKQYIDSDGRPIAEEAIKEFEVKRKSYDNQGLRKPLEIETIALKNIKAITINRKQFLVTD